MSSDKKENVVKRFWLRAKSAVTGRFITVTEALRNKAISYIEKVERKNSGK
jgi:hypothetical protein